MKKIFLTCAATALLGSTIFISCKKEKGAEVVSTKTEQRQKQSNSNSVATYTTNADEVLTAWYGFTSISHHVDGTLDTKLNYLLKGDDFIVNNSLESLLDLSDVSYYYLPDNKMVISIPFTGAGNKALVIGVKDIVSGRYETVTTASIENDLDSHLDGNSTIKWEGGYSVMPVTGGVGGTLSIFGLNAFQICM